MAMEKYEARRKSLLKLMYSQCEGKVATLAKRLDRSDSYVARMLYPDDKAGRKRIGEEMAELIEKKFGLEAGGLDGVDINPTQTSVAPPTTFDSDIQHVIDMLLATDSEGRILAKNAVIDSLTQYAKRRDAMAVLTKK